MFLLDGHPPSRNTLGALVVSPPASPPSKSPLLFIANGFRIMMPGWLRDPIQIPRVSSSGPTRPLLPPAPFASPHPTLLAYGVVIAGGVIALARDLSNNLLCTIPPRHIPPPRRLVRARPLGVDLLLVPFFTSISLSPASPFLALSLSLSPPFLFLSFSFSVRLIEDREHSAGRSEKLSGS